MAVCHVQAGASVYLGIGAGIVAALTVSGDGSSARAPGIFYAIAVYNGTARLAADTRCL